MITFPRSAARRVRLLARKIVPSRSRSSTPPVSILSTSTGIVIAVGSDEAIIAVSVSGLSGLNGSLTLPMAAMEAVEGSDDGLVTVDETSKSRVTVRWYSRGLPRSQDFDRLHSKASITIPSLPDTFVPVSKEFLRALDDAGRCTTREPKRYALNRIQIRGQAGEIIGTDAYFVFRREGLQLPFKDEILIPALPLFGLPELTNSQLIRIGCTDRHFVIVADEVTIYLAIDREGRFPDVASVIPKTPKPATLRLDPDDALFLLDTLPALPGSQDEHKAVTLDLIPGPAGIVRANAECSREVVEVRLNRSSVTFGPVQMVIDRRFLIRMLTLGCRTFRAASTQQPIVATGEAITTIAVALDSSHIVPPSRHARVLQSTSLKPRSRRSCMKTPETLANGSSDSEANDPLFEAEALRTALGEAQQRLGKLVSSLRSKRKEQKALSQV